MTMGRAHRLPTVLVVPDERLRAEFEQRRGTPVQTSLDLPAEPWLLADRDITCVVAIRDESSVVSVVEALLRGVDLVVALPALDEAWIGRLERDLARLGEVSYGRLPEPDPIDALNDDQRQLLELLGGGASIPDAAQTLFLSVRTAERRIGAARRLLGVRTTAEAVIMLAGRGVGA